MRIKIKLKEPPFQIKEKPLLYYTFKPYADQHADIIYRAINKYSNPKYVDAEELREVIEMHSKKDQQGQIPIDKILEAKMPRKDSNASPSDFDVNSPKVLNNSFIIFRQMKKANLSLLQFWQTWPAQVGKSAIKEKSDF